MNALTDGVVQPERILMLDIETLAKDTDKAVIWQVCLIGYDIESGSIIPVRHNQYYPIQPQLDRGRVIEADTLIYWMSQPDAAREKIVECASQDPEEIQALLVNFTTMFNALTDGKPYELYGNSPSFDCTKLKSLFNDWGFEAPWDFRKERDLRTLCALAGINPKAVPHVPGFIAHDALSDCLQQIAIWKAARGNEAVE